MNKKRWKKISRRLKKKATFPEKLFRSVLEELNVGFKFQAVMRIPYWHPIVVDFYLEKRGIVFEIDGSSHSAKEQIYYDRMRDENLAALRIRTFRFTNAEVLESRYEVAKKVAAILGIKYD